MNPGVFKVDVLIVVADSYHVVSIIEVGWVGSVIIIIFPCLNEYDNWSSFC